MKAAQTASRTVLFIELEASKAMLVPFPKYNPH